MKAPTFARPRPHFGYASTVPHALLQQAGAVEHAGSTNPSAQKEALKLLAQLEGKLHQIKHPGEAKHPKKSLAGVADHMPDVAHAVDQVLAMHLKPNPRCEDETI